MSQPDIHQAQGCDANRILVVGAGAADTALLRSLHDMLEDHGFGVVFVDKVPLLRDEPDWSRLALEDLSRALDLRSRTLRTQAPGYGWYRRFEGRRRDKHRF